MAENTAADRDVLIAQFTNITGTTPERARFYLEAAAWNFSLATNSFFDEDSREGEEMRETAPVQERRDGRGHDELVPADGSQDTLPTHPPPSSSSSSQSKKTGIASMAEYQRKKREEEKGRSSKEGEGQSFFAGGSEHSGQMISGPPRKKVDAKELASDVFAAAKSQGARSVEDEEKERQAERLKAFRGTGFRLGETEAPSQQIHGGPTLKPTEKVQHTLTFWSNGFSVDNGPLRTGESPEDRAFIKSVSKGEIPQELIRAAKGGEVDINIEDNRNDEYRARAPKLVAFSGEGHKLGSIAPAIASSSVQSQLPGVSSGATPGPSSSSSSAPPTVPLDPAQPTTSIQIRLADGSRLVAKFNPSHTVNDIRQYINLSRPAMSSAHYVLMTTFPNRELTDPSQTLSDAKLLNAVVVQRMK